jgi:hypothetical protein
MLQPDYRIYPSLLDKFQSLIDYELECEEAWNIVSENAHKQGKHLDKEVGDYILSPDEMYTKIEAELIDMINRVDGIPSEAADKGTCFNEIIDCLIENRKSSNPDINIRSEKIDNGTTAIFATLNGFSFAFDADFCKEVAKCFKGALTQYLCRANILTKYGDVEIYGYIDEYLPARIVDIKTTSYYNFGKFERKWQRYAYPYCVIESGASTQIDEFEYYVVQWNKSAQLLSGTIHREIYSYKHRHATERLREHIEHFLWWLNTRRQFITNPRIFGGELPQGYVGYPIDINLLNSKYNGK